MPLKSRNICVVGQQRLRPTDPPYWGRGLGGVGETSSVVSLGLEAIRTAMKPADSDVPGHQEVPGPMDDLTTSPTKGSELAIAIMMSMMAMVLRSAMWITMVIRVATIKMAMAWECPIIITTVIIIIIILTIIIIIINIVTIMFDLHISRSACGPLFLSHSHPASCARFSPSPAPTLCLPALPPLALSASLPRTMQRPAT